MNGTLDNISKLLEEALLVIAAHDPSRGEARIKRRLKRLGFEVVVKGADEVKTSHASGVSVIVICSGSSAQAVNTKFHDVAVPVVVLNHELFQIMRMAHKPKKESRQTAVRILDRAHPMAAGLANDVTVCAAATMFWGKPHKSALKVASAASDGSKFVWFAYERGSEMIGKRAKTGKSRDDQHQDENDTQARSDGDAIAQAPTAPARRVGLFFSDEVALHATLQGWSLFSAAVCWAAGREALLVVGSIDPMSQGDKKIERKLQGLGYAVTVKDDKEASRADAKRKSVIILSSTVSTDRVKTEFRHSQTPVVVLKGGLFTAMGMTGAENGDYGEVAGQTDVEIIKGGHPMAAGSSGKVNVCKAGQYVSWGNPAGSASRIATQEGDHSRTLIFGYKGGSQMVGLEAPARRVGLFFSDGVAESCNRKGWTLFAAAAAWAVDSREKEALFVVGSTHSIRGKLSSGDKEIKKRIEGLCYSVTLRDWADGERSDVDGKSLVVISSTVDEEVVAGQNNYTFADAIAPVLCMSANVFPLLGMTGRLHGTDYGQESARQIEITDPHHSMAAGSNGVAELSAVDVPMAWGDSSSRKAKKVIRVASHLGDQTRAALFGYEADAQMPGRRSPARRVGFCFSDALAVDATDKAWRLFDSAVNWAAGLGVMEFRDIFIEEWQEVLERRAKFYEERASRARCHAPENLVGLALSGGGIRSATFCLGFLQGLHDAGRLRIFDYLSTVSGGGYLGGWWSAWLSREEREEKEGIFPEAEGIEPTRTASYIGRDAKDKVAEGSMCAGKDPIHHLRLFANYLTPRKGTLSGDTWRATAVVSRNLIMTWLIMVPVIIGFVLLGQLYFVLQENSLSDFLFPFWQKYGQVLDQRKDYASDFAGISLDKEKQDKFEQTAEYLAAKTGSDYKETVALLRRKLAADPLAADPSEPLSENEEHKLRSFSKFLSGESLSSEKRKDFDDLAAIISVQSVDGYKGIVQQLDENGFRYISKYLPPKYEEKKKEIGSLIEYFRSAERQAPVILSAETVDSDPVERVKQWLRSLSKSIIAESLESDAQPKVEELANSLSAISQKRIIDLRKDLTTQSLDQEQTKVVDRIMEEATGPLRQKHESDLRDRTIQIIVPLLPVAGLIVLMIVLWMRTGMPAISWAYFSHSLGGLAAFAILLCTVLLFMFPVSDIGSSLKSLGSLVWRWQYLLAIGIWICVATCLWLYVRPWSIRPPSNADRFGIEEWRKEVRRNKIERVHSTLLVLLVITGAVLVISGFGHEIVDYVWADPQPKKWLVDYVAKAGGWVAVIAAIGGSIYTAVKASPSGGADNRQSGKETLTNRFMFAITPPLVVVVLAVVAAWAAHWLLGRTVNEHILASDLGKAHRFPPLTMAIVVGVALCLYFAVYEMERRKGWVAVAAFIAVCVIEVIGGLTYWKFKWGLSRELHLVLVSFILAVGGLIFFRLMVREVDDPTRRSRVFERFQLRVLWDLFKSKKGLWISLAVCSVVLPIAALVPANQLLPNATESRVPLSGLSLCWLVGIIMCLTFFVFEILAGKGDNRRSLWLAAVMYAALCALFVFSFYRNYAEHSSIMLGHAALGLLAMTFTWVVALGWMADPNRLSLHTFYRSRLVRAYMGASNPIRRNQLNEITESAAGDDVLLHHLRNCRNGAPYHIMNTTLSLVGGRDLTTAQRSAAVFAMSKRYCGSSRTGYRKSEDYMSGRLTLGTAVAVSGAAVSPTMGAKNPTASLAMLMTLLNIRLGYWAPAPNKEAWQADQARLWPFYMLHEFMSQTNDVATYCYLTDGGHFDNTGLYSLVERGCRYIVVVDNGQDPQPCFQDLGDAIRRCRIDFGTEIHLELTPLFKTQGEEKQYAKQHFVAGRITYSAEHVRQLKWAGDIDNENRRRGIIVLIKPSLAGDETADLWQYGLENDSFPQHKTSDQWFGEAQFESYRRLGKLSADRVFGKIPKTGAAADGLTLYDVEQIFEEIVKEKPPREEAAATPAKA